MIWKESLIGRVVQVDFNSNFQNSFPPSLPLSVFHTHTPTPTNTPTHTSSPSRPAVEGAPLCNHFHFDQVPTQAGRCTACLPLSKQEPPLQRKQQLLLRSHFFLTISFFLLHLYHTSFPQMHVSLPTASPSLKPYATLIPMLRRTIFPTITRYSNREALQELRESLFFQAAF